VVTGGREMRRIKFRGKRTDNGEWVHGNYKQLTVYIDADGNSEEKDFITEPCHEGFEYENTYPVIPETVGQDTGLKDKNGKEIYEGDIVNCSFENRGVGVIGFSLNNQQTMIYENYNCDKPMCDLDYLTAGFCKVIGNIYENPELLEVLTHDDSI
jgi:uncharacterized phage protein (TIGR01671 family)